MAEGHEHGREEALDKLFELAVRLGEVMQRGLAERGLTASRAEALLVLRRDGDLVQRQLSEALRCTPRYVTAVVDALEAEGLARRRPHPTDRRATLVSLTTRGTAAAARMGAERQQAAAWLLGDVPEADLDTFVAIADQVIGRVAAVPAASRSASQSRTGPRTRGRTQSKQGAAAQEER